MIEDDWRGCMLKNIEEIARRDKEACSISDDLLEAVTRIVRSKLRQFYIRGYEEDDLVQEIRIYIWENFYNWDPDKSSFLSYSIMICRERMKLLLNQQNLQNGHIQYMGDMPLKESPQEHQADPVFEMEDVQPYMGATLTELESGACEGYLRGFSYRESAKKMKCKKKSIDNALGRAKYKIRKNDDIKRIVLKENEDD